MKEYDIAPLLQTLKERKDIFICGPKYGGAHLRVYAHGGRLCELPATDAKEITMPDPNYFLYASEAALPKLKEAFHLVKKPPKYKNSKFPYSYGYARMTKRNEERAQLLLDNLEEILNAMRNRFSTASGAVKERGIQNMISCTHTSFAGADRTVICDWENSIPVKIYAAADSGQAEKKPNFDMIAFFLSGGRGVFSIIELKCSRKACTNSKSGLVVHARDMLVCERSDGYKEELIRRLKIMAGYGLLRDIPDNLDDVLQHPEDIELRKCFLFTSGEGLRDWDDAASLRPSVDNADSFYYMFAEDPEAVDLSKMEPWEDPSSGRDRQ